MERVMVKRQPTEQTDSLDWHDKVIGALADLRNDIRNVRRHLLVLTVVVGLLILALVGTKHLDLNGLVCAILNRLLGSG
jgi:hypothetical protein